MFTLNSGTLAEPTQIKSDGDFVSETATVTVNAPGYAKYKVAGTPALFFWTNRSLTNAATIARDGVTTYYTTIQAAITAAVSDDTINVAAGTYAESILIDKPLTLDGGTGTKPVISGLAPANYIVKVEGTSDVTLNNLEINGGGTVAGANTFFYGVWVNGSGTEGSPVEIKNSTVKNIWNASPKAAIDVDSTSYTLINNVDISGFQKRGVRFTNSSGKVFDGDITGESVDGTTRVQNLINLWGGSSVEIYNNALHDAKSSGGTPTWDSPAIFISSFGGNGASHANIHNNEIYNGDTGVVVGSVYAATSDDPSGELNTDISDADIINNYFHNLNWGINFEKETGSAVVTGNKFENNTKAVNAEGDGAPLENPPLVNATNNWWGNASGPTIASNPTGTGDSIYVGVSYSPWYINAGRTTLSDAVVMPDESGNATVTDTNKDVIVTSASQPLIIEAGDVEDATIDFGSLVSSGTGSIPQTTVNSDVAQIEIPATTITSSDTGWDGTVNLPQIVITTVQPTVEAGNTATAVNSIEVGFGDTHLTFDDSVKLTFPGLAGSLIGWSQNGVFHEINSFCDSATAPTLAADSECKVNVSPDLVVWTKHFTTFTSYTQSSAPVVGRSSQSGDTNRGVQSVAVAPVVGEVLGASTVSAEVQAQIAGIKVQLRALISQLIALLQQQLAAAITAQGN